MKGDQYYEPYVETIPERAARFRLDREVRRKDKTRYAIQMNLCGPNDGKVFPKCWLPLKFLTAPDAWEYARKIPLFRVFPDAYSYSVERI